MGGNGWDLKVQAMNMYTAMLYETPLVKMLKDQELGSIRRRLV
jgi:hypothetical protein